MVDIMHYCYKDGPALEKMVKSFMVTILVLTNAKDAYFVYSSASLYMYRAYYWMGQ